MSTQSIILAAGKGTRLAPITNTRSKGMLPILGKPFLERIIRGMLSSGLRNFILVVNPEDHEIREYFQKEFSLDVQIQFIDQDRQLGTAHALRLAAPHITGDFFLSACDSLVPEGEMNLLVSTWSRYPGSQGLLSLERIPQKDADKTGIVTLEGDKVSGIVEKPLPAEAPSNISSTPLYAFSSRILDYLSQLPISPRGEYELQGAIQMMIDEGQTVNGIFLKNRLTLTTAEDLLAINLDYLYAQAQRDRVVTKNIGSHTNLVEPVFIEEGVEIGSNCQIGPGVYIEKNVRIGDDVQLENVVVLRNTTIATSTRLKDRVIS
ncbi:MAG: sugar phosphate nucleotidyltransferase [Anaerolineales bacterium]|jgi:bifunctional UDP-N-acetylglucosamine pyrophosphorylase/glucosamine-1-phosphate N-acetyltransferase|nr:NDP-sugar synthase [Anaerolineales bacterium]